MAREYKVFVSHSWSYGTALEKLRTMLNERGYFKVDFQEATPQESINSENATYIKRKLKERILGSEIVLGIAGVYATHSDWMTWELKTASDNAIPIVGVIPEGNQKISTMVSGYAKEIVEWDTEKIVEAIRKHALPAK